MFLLYLQQDLVNALLTSLQNQWTAQTVQKINAIWMVTVRILVMLVVKEDAANEHAPLVLKVCIHLLSIAYL